MRVLGIDPGLRITGYAVVELSPAANAFEPTLVEGGVLRFKGGQSIEDRLAQMYADLNELIETAKPTRVAVEKLYSHYAHPRTAILMGHARGVILLCARLHNLPIEHMPSTAVKKAMTGHGHASKEQMQRAVQAQCRLKELPSPPDLADAIAIAMTCARRIAIERM
jgi:crossover junction endodeoxyribonuclease RuvC